MVMQVTPTPRTLRTLVRDAAEFARALGALAGLGFALVAAVAIGSLLGGSDPRAPLARDADVIARFASATTPGGAGAVGASVFDGLAGGGREAAARDDGAGSGRNGGSTGNPPRSTRGGDDDLPLPDDPNVPDVPNPSATPNPGTLGKLVDDLIGGGSGDTPTGDGDGSLGDTVGRVTQSPLPGGNPATGGGSGGSNGGLLQDLLGG